jgi:hypothetical protein
MSRRQIIPFTASSRPVHNQNPIQIIHWRYDKAAQMLNAVAVQSLAVTVTHGLAPEPGMLNQSSHDSVQDSCMVMEILRRPAETQAAASKAIQKFVADAFARSPYNLFVLADPDPGQAQLRKDSLRDVEPQITDPATMAAHRLGLHWSVNGSYPTDDETRAATGRLHRVSTLECIDILSSDRAPKEILPYYVDPSSQQQNWLREDLESLPDDFDENSLDNVPPLARSLAITASFTAGEYTSWLEPKIDSTNRTTGDMSARAHAKWTLIHERLNDVGIL